jgi:hypothetical protein
VREELEPSRFREREEEIRDVLKAKINQLFGSAGYKLVQKTRLGDTDVPAIFDNLDRNFPAEKLRSMRVIVHGQARKRRPTDPVELDERCYVDLLRPANGELFTCQVGLPADLEILTNLTVAVEDKNNIPLQLNAYWHRYKEGASTRGRVLIFLKEPIKSDRCPIKVSVRFEAVRKEEGVFNKFDQRGWDWQRTMVQHHDEVGENVWVGVVAQGQQVTMCDILDCPAPWQELIRQEIKLGALDEGTWVRGEGLPPDQVRGILADAYKGDLSPHAGVFGWKVGKMSRNESSGFVYHKPS